MSIVSIDEPIQPAKYLVVSQQKDSETTITTRLIISDTRVNQVTLLAIEKGPQGDAGPQGPRGLPGQDGVVFDVLPISSGGTNNTIFNSGYIIYYDGNKLTSAAVPVDALSTGVVLSNSLTGVIASSGLISTSSSNDSTINLSVSLGDGLTFNPNNEIIVDDTIARVGQLSFGNLSGTLPIIKGGTNNNFFSQNRLVYFDGSKLRSYPIETGRFLLSGNTSIDIIAGSGLAGGGQVSVPNGSVIINIPESSDIIIEDNLLRLSNTGTPGVYSKVVTDSKGRVVSGTVLSTNDIINILGYTPYHPGNDGPGSSLDADLLDSEQGSFYRNATNLTGVLNIDILPSTIPSPGLYTKVAVNTKGLIEGTYFANQEDIISSLGYRPINASGDIVDGPLTVNQNLNIGGELSIYDNLPLLALNSPNILPSAPRGITFKYGGLYNTKTGIIAFYPTDNELKLVTNIFASGADINGGNTDNNQDDINGGDADSVFIVDNLEGDQSTVLLRHIADQLYVKTTTEQNINGFKTFLNGIAVNDQIVIYDKPTPSQPPLNIGNNNLLVTNLNADYLDGNHGSFYRNAANATGSFSYTNVSFDHIQGTNNFIPRFNDLSKTPAGRITNSTLYQDTTGNIRLDDSYNLSVGGDSNTFTTDTENSLAIGLNNRITNNNSIAAGQENIVSGENAVALNYRSSSIADKSIAAGSYGHTWLQNQFALGGFRVFGTGNTSLEHGQQSTTTMYLMGVEAHESWQTLQPLIPIPKNKTLAYDVELLISKAFGTGVAHFHFTSGIVKNASFRDPNNPINLVNITTHPQLSRKISGFNNSQIKTHFHTYELGTDVRVQQNIKVASPPLIHPTPAAQNVEEYYYYRPEKKQVTGVYTKLNDGSLELDIDKPLFSGIFIQNSTTPNIQIISYAHSGVPGAHIQPVFTPNNLSGIGLPNISRLITSVTDKSFYVEPIYLSGYLSYESYEPGYDLAKIVINSNSLKYYDKDFYFRSSAIIQNVSIVNITNQSLLKFLRPGMNLKILIAGQVHDRVVVSTSTNTITINSPLYNTNDPNPLFNSTIEVYSIEYAYYLFKIADRVFIKRQDNIGGQFFANFETKQSVTNFQATGVFPISGNPAPPTGFTLPAPQNSGVYASLDFSDEPSIGLDVLVSKQASYTSGIPIAICPLFYNSGVVNLHHKASYSGTYSTSPTVFNKYQGVYTRTPEGRIFLYNSELEPISLPFAPIKYTLVNGYGDIDNNKFNIYMDNNRYILKTNALLNYEDQDTYSIRIKAENNNSTEFFEKNILVYANDSLKPYRLVQNLPPQSAIILQPFTYTLPTNLFFEEEGGGAITLSATLKGWNALPDWLTFNTESGIFSGTPSGCSLGPQTIRVLATNASGNYGYIDLRLVVSDTSLQASNLYNTASSSITNIHLSNYSIDENLPSGTSVGLLSSDGSYNPYCVFKSAFNNFSGIFRNRSNLIESLLINNTYPTTSLTGTPEFLSLGSVINTLVPSPNPPGSFPSGTKVTHVYKPSIWSGTPLIDSDTIIFTDTDNSYDQIIYSGIKIFTDTQYFDPNTTIKTWNDYSFVINTAILQENTFLLWTENNNILVHNDTTTAITNGLDSEFRENLFTENQEKLLLEDKLKINTIWASGCSACDNGALLNNVFIRYHYDSGNISYQNTTTVDTSRALYKLNAPSDNSLMTSSMGLNHQRIVFQEPVNNAVMAIYDLGLDSWGELLAENDEILLCDNNDILISDSFFDHGSRVLVSDNYELLDTVDTYKNNGKLETETNWGSLITEDNNYLVHDYAIVSKKGSAYIIFPGYNTNINLNYPAITATDNTVDYNKNIFYTFGSLIPFTFSTNKYFVRVDQEYTGQLASGLVVYSGVLPETNNYSISGLKLYSYLSPQGVCPFDLSTTGVKGFETAQTPSNYVTGLVDFYTEAGTGVIDLLFAKDSNIDHRYENHLFLHNLVKTSSGNINTPAQGWYTKDSLSNISANSIRLYNQFFLPASGGSSVGTFRANIDKNHGYVVEHPTQLNHVPVQFNNVSRAINGINTEISLRPKNNIFNVLSISGNKVFVNDSRNYLLKEANRPDYFDRNIRGHYTTNGLIFSGTAFYDSANFYDLRYDMNTLERIIKRSTFEYKYAPSSRLSINIPSGSIRPFDDLIVRFASGAGYDTPNIYKLIDTNTISVRSGLFDDLEPLKDTLLLESSESYQQPNNFQRIAFDINLASLNRDVKGTCDLDLRIEHRLQSGYLINYSNSNITGHKILSIQSGFSFSGFIPKFNNAISTDINHLLLPEHSGFASVFNTGTAAMLVGGKLLRQALPSDKGYADYYFVGATGLVSTKISFNGIGTVDNPYYENIQPTNQHISYDFLYLGQNNNTARFYGNVTLSGVSQLEIYKTTLADQLQILQLANKGISSGLIPIFATGNTSGPIDISVPAQRFDKFTVLLKYNPPYTNQFALHTEMLSGVNIKPWILDSDTHLNNRSVFWPYLNPEEPSYVYQSASGGLSIQYIPVVDPEYSMFNKSFYYILPFIRTDTKYCQNLLAKNTTLFFNGNTIAIDTLNIPKTYSQELDEFKLLAFNNQTIHANAKTGKYITKIDSSNNTSFFTGIITDGNMSIGIRSGLYRFAEIYEDRQRFDTTFGISHNSYLPYTGYVDYIKSTSGYMNILDHNNIYFHTYGGSTACWPMDTAGKIVPTVQTGIYFVSNNPSSCSSGTLCVTVVGFNNVAFTGMKQINNRSVFGQNPNIISAGDTKGYIRPYGIDNKFYFDFSDGFTEINGVYHVNDLINPSTLTLNIPYRSDFVGRAGIVYLIDSEQNIKSHLNPNLDNQFINSNGLITFRDGISAVGPNGLLSNNTINYFDNNTKRWKHVAHLKTNIAYTGHKIILNGSNSTILSLNPDSIRISGLEYRFGEIAQNFEPVTNNQINVPSNETLLTLKITTLDGEQKLIEQYSASMPRVSLSGLYDYVIDTNQPSQYRYHGSGWILGANITLPQYKYNTTPLTIKAKDFTGEDQITINLNRQIVPPIKAFGTSYAIANSTWSIGFDVPELDIYDLWANGDIGFNLLNSPSGLFSVQYITDHAVILTGPSSSGTGNYPVTVQLRDFRTEPFSTLASGTGLISILNNYSQQPAFAISANNLSPTYYFDITQSSGMLTVDIPAKLGPTPDLVNLQISFSNNPAYRFQVMSNAYDHDLERFHIIAKPIQTGNYSYVDFTGRYTNQTINISISQPVYDQFGNAIYTPYSRTFTFDTVFYKPLELYKTVLDSSLVFAIGQPWFLQLDVKEGITAHNPQLRPRIRIHNTPNFGSYETFPAEYNLDWNYNNSEKKWSATISAKKDFFGKYVYNTGIYPLYVSVHDGLLSSSTTSTAIRYIPQLSLKNIQNTLYATPDNEFFANADIYDINSTNTSITNIVGSLKEPSVQIDNTVANYDKDFNIWQYGFTGSKFDEKYGAQIVVDSNNLAVQCKGLGRDKIIAVAKLNMVEIESSELAGLPLTITGILGYNPNGTSYSQGSDAWSLRFKTIGGLADHRYPPTIILQNMPTFCNGYNPLINPQEQCVISPPLWNPDDMGGSWSYVFSGLPSCTLLGRKDFSITAIDTNPTLTNPYLPDTDTVDYFFTYNELAVAHNPPLITTDSTYPAALTMKPLCGVKYQNRLLFGPGQAALCGSATGVKLIEISGSVPSGLSYSVFFPGIGDNPNPEPPYSNLGSGSLTIEGFPLTFANGGPYSEELRLTITDARNLKTSQLITFIDSSQAIEPNISFPMFFDAVKPILSPKTGLAPVSNPETVRVYRPAPASYDLACQSRLPHNKCAIEYVLYSGTTTTNTNIALIPSGTSTLTNDSEIYIEFNGDNTHPLNSTYKVLAQNNQFFINPGINILPVSGYARLVKGISKDLRIKNFDAFFADTTPDTTVNKCLLGAGGLIRDVADLPEQPLGLGGLLIPTITGALTGMNIFSSSDIFLTGLTLSDLDANNNNNYATIKWSNCWETGYVRISGIVLPPISVEIPDPPPAQDFAPFSFNGQVYALATKLSFGDNEAQKLLLQNQRRGRSLQYRITDLLTQNTIANGSVSSFSSFDTPVLNTASGTVYSVSIAHSGDVFPTYNRNALPSANNIYYWPHKGDNLFTTPTQTAFPPLYPVINPPRISVINDTEDLDPNGSIMVPITGAAIGGYITTPGSSWSSRDYVPVVSGIIQRSLERASISGNFVYNNQTINLTIPQNSISANYVLKVFLYRLAFDDSLIIPPTVLDVEVPSTGLISNNTILTLPLNSGAQSFNGRYNIEMLSRISGYIPETNSVFIRHNNLSFATGDIISIDQTSTASTSLYGMDKWCSLSVASGDSSLLLLTNSNPSDSGWINAVDSAQPVQLMKYFDDNIKIMPYNTTGIINGRYSFQITGRSNVLYKDFIYKICTLENNNMPAFSGAGLIPKRYFVNYPLHVNKPIRVVTNSITKTGMGSSWSLTFRVEGGARPVYENTPDVQLSLDGINFSYCGFTRATSQPQYKDAYDATFDQLVIQLYGNNAINWGSSDIYVKVQDNTGSDIVQISTT